MGAAAKRYARAIFELAEEEKKVDQWSQRLELVRQILANEQVRQVVRNPSIPTEERVAFVEKLDLPGLGAEGLNLLRLLVSNHRVDQADEIAAEFMSQADEAAGRIRATATTAVELSAADRDGFAKDLSAGIGKDVRLEVSVDPAILGGLVLQIGDRLLDASVAGRLQQLRRQVVTR